MSYKKIKLPRPDKLKADLNEYLTRGQKIWYTVTEHYLTEEHLYLKLETKIKSTVQVTDYDVSTYNGYGTPFVEIDGKKWVALSDVPMPIHLAYDCLRKYLNSIAAEQKGE